MSLEGVSVSDINSMISRTTETIVDVNDENVRKRLSEMKKHLSDMRVALVELENVEERHSRGDLTPDIYFDRRKKLVRDFYAARDEIADNVVPGVAKMAQTQDQKSALSKFKDLLKNNREFVVMGLDFVLTVARTFARA
jgi:hypothetical protein